MSDLIDRQAAIEALRGYLVGKRCPDDGTLTCRLIENEVINKLPPAQPEPMKIDLSRCSEENWERIKKEWANTPITTIAAQPYTIIDGRLFITVDDIEQVDCVLVAEYKSKFCREFWMADADEPAQPERIIHCKDCEWWTKQECSPQGRCALSGMYPTGGWFCGNARRREVTT